MTLYPFLLKFEALGQVIKYDLIGFRKGSHVAVRVWTVRTKHGIFRIALSFYQRTTGLAGNGHSWRLSSEQAL